MVTGDESQGSDAWAWAAMEPEPTARDKALYDLFAEEFLVDGDPIMAAYRCGFMDGFAKEWGERLFRKAYVQKRIKQLRDIIPDEKTEATYLKRVVINTLRETATNKYAKDSARVQAAAQLKQILGMDAPVKSTQEITHKGGVIMVPAIANIDDWEAAAQASQGALAEASRV
jgi:hypothetical protein